MYTAVILGYKNFYNLLPSSPFNSSLLQVVVIQTQSFCRGFHLTYVYVRSHQHLKLLFSTLSSINLLSITMMNGN